MKKLIDWLDRAFSRLDVEAHLIVARLFCGFVVGWQVAVLVGFDSFTAFCAGLLAADVIQRRL